MRTFDSGATRDNDARKIDFEGFLSPLVLERFGRYMRKHRRQADGGLRDSDNWQKGIPRDAYMKSAFRHFMAWWMAHRGWKRATANDLEDLLCAVLFNVQGYLHEHLAIKRNSVHLRRPLHGRDRKAENVKSQITNQKSKIPKHRHA
jgi:hypothetical protein